MTRGREREGGCMKDGADGGTWPQSEHLSPNQPTWTLLAPTAVLFVYTPNCIHRILRHLLQ